MDCSLSGSSTHGIFQARVLEWVAIAFSSHPAYLTYGRSTSYETRLEEAQAGIKIAGRHIYNLRYADDTTLMAESEELKSLFMKVE